ncbi:hypothetical protein Q1695_006663 [Nippostrongylus brasiliensis]|nr:hypothetical protein Q1695_006663 [Nippostrongylus brasiliensis]
MLDQTTAMPSNADLLQAILQLQAHVESTFNHMASRIHSLEGALTELLERSKLKSACIFCPLEENRGGHTTSRCNRFPDVVAKSMQVARSGLCGRCLQPAHSEDDDCGVHCTACGGMHNVLLCSNCGGGHRGGFKRRRP